ncbi:MAG: hypothetical protein PHP50_06150 [Lachnospiraceae bacterium]|nr:hypothetical protein [Lachnospiraceae bacterium]
MEEQLEQRKKVLQYRGELEKLARYIPWLQSKQGQQLVSTFSGNDIEKNSLTFPVYDGTLMGFVKEAAATELMNRNYLYDYRKYRIKDAADEEKFIAVATVREWNVLCSILSYYVLKGMTKTTLWNEGVSNGIMLKVLLKMKDIVEFWDKPLA